jgi:hypothetical protein
VSASSYRSLERQIAASDAGTLWGRWVYGRRLLCDPSATGRDGSLRPGKMAGLVEAAHRAGVRLTEEEILGRLRAARSYPCESQIRKALRRYGTWDALADAEFPEQEAEPGEAEYDPRTAAEQAQQAERQLALGEPDQLALFELFPREKFSDRSTLAELAEHAALSEDITKRFQDRNRRRAGYLARLSSAVNGDMSKTWAEAQAAADAAATA